MKYLPCSTCGQTALATTAGLLQCAGQMLDSSMRYLCRRCGHTTVLTSAEFVRLPEMTEDEIKAETCDLPWPLPDPKTPA